MSMTVRSFAALHDVDERTVQRWLRDGKLAGAVKTNKGWVIPEDAAAPVPGQPAPPASHAGGTVARTSSAVTTPAVPALPQGGGLSAYLETLPAFVDLATAVSVLGITEQAIRRNADELGAKPWGPRGTLVVPVRAVRDAAGL